MFPKFFLPNYPHLLSTGYVCWYLEVCELAAAWYLHISTVDATAQNVSILADNNHMNDTVQYFDNGRVSISTSLRPGGGGGIV